MSRNDYKKVSLVLPFYNEGSRASQTITSLMRALGDREYVEIICVQNGSTDDTRRVLEDLTPSFPQMRIVEVPVNRGYGYGIRTGLKSATGDMVGYCDGDGQISPVAVMQIVDIASSGSSVRAVRITRDDGTYRQLVSWIFKMFFSILFFQYVNDINAKPKFFSRKDLDLMDLTSDDWFIDAEVMIKSRYLGIRFETMPISFLKREGGKSNVRTSTLYEFMLNLLDWKFGPKLNLWKKSLAKNK